MIPRGLQKPRSIAGVTLVELMITVFILSIGVLAAIGSFRYITVSLQNSKARLLANNLAQEQIEKLKNLSYYTLLVTTSPYSDTRFSPALDYDTGNYSAQTLIEGGMSYTRATRVDLVYQSGASVVAVPPTDNDTGLKLITVYIIWRNGADLHYQEMHNLMANPAANPLNATFSGTVTNSATSAPIAGALVQVVDNSNWFGFTDNSGNYHFNVSQGSYTLICSSQGYFSKTTPSYLSITSGQTFTQNFTLGLMGTGRATGNIYLVDHLLISQVVATSNTATDSYEYVELYNPTTFTIFIGTNSAVNSPPGVPIFWDSSNNPSVRHLFYMNSYVPSHSYYLLANTGNANPATTCQTLPLGGGPAIQPDACWQKVPHPAHALAQAEAGGFSIGNQSSYTGSTTLTWVSSNWPSPGKIDSVAWSKNASAHSAPSNAVEDTGISTTGGLDIGELLIRTTEPGLINTSYGRSYDSNDNRHDFLYFSSYSNAPKTTTGGTVLPMSGTPAAGAFVAFNDPLSNVTTCSMTSVTTGNCFTAGAPGCDVCSFSTPGIATGTWTMVVSSGTFYQETTNVNITASVSTGVPNGSTNPSWVASGASNTLLFDTTGYAFISGVVTNAGGTPLSGINVTAGGLSVQTAATGRYFLSVATGDVVILANYNNQNRAYTTQSSTLTTVAGVLYDTPTGGGHTWFTLSLGGILTGYIKTGSNTPLPGRVAVALSGGNINAQAVSGSDGHFYLANLTTGTYTIEPSLDPAEVSYPSSATVVLTSTGSATQVSTFTVTSGLSEITGQVLHSSVPITTGVLVIASTSTLSGGSTTPPPAIQGADSILCDPCSYGASSDATGQYSIMLRSSATPYKVYGWYTTFSGSNPTVQRQGPYTVNVSTAGQILSQNLAW